MLMLINFVRVHSAYSIFVIYLDLNPSLLDVPGLEEDFVLNADLLLTGRDPGCSSITPSSSMA